MKLTATMILSVDGVDGVHAAPQPQKSRRPGIEGELQHHAQPLPPMLARLTDGS